LPGIDDETQEAAGAWRSTLIVTGSDAKFFTLGSELIASIRACGPADVAIAYYDFGLTAEQQDWLRQNHVIVRRPEVTLVPPATVAQWPAALSCISRPFLRENFPGYRVYVFIDADAWVQDWAGVQALHDGAVASGAAVVSERERAYRFWPWLIGWRVKHFVRGCGAATGLWLAARPHINAGVFAMHADAPHWERWQARYRETYRRTGVPQPHDQFTLNATIHLDGLASTFLPATCNWICDLAAPMWDSGRRTYCLPYRPYTPIGVLHLAGPAKSATFDIRATDGTTRRTGLRYAAGRVPAHAAA
jgi:hypothetical protein